MQENRVHTLKKEVDHCTRMAELIEYNLEDVDAAILAVRVALANGMDWKDLAHMVKEEKKSGNPVAGLIDKLNLERNCIALLLSNNLDEMDDDEKTQPVDKVLFYLESYLAGFGFVFFKHICINLLFEKLDALFLLLLWIYMCARAQYIYHHQQLALSHCSGVDSKSYNL